jgi:hypothetical protein
MSFRQSPELLARQREIVAAPVQRACDNQTFELPTGIYVAMAALLFGFLAVLTIGFGNPGLAVPMAINVIFLTAFFAIPAIFVGAGDGRRKTLSWHQLMRRGVETEAGRAGGGEAAILVLMLPAFIFCWAIAVVTINALV